MKCRSSKCRKLHESFKKRELEIYNTLQKRLLHLRTNIALAKVYEKSHLQIKNPPRYTIPIHFDNKRLKFIHLNSILHRYDIKNFLLESLW